ncbi:hypothetical protein CVT26_005157 [Gymnopilus dilepis]|uniref:F-box domain-containing protein n=1 Tax=Gymnopilus dilepis TaxID=231916 RepID=A0A409X505_9AGAR|nr:hypothetical protein CVT26_005157 [Gymnopilus dilepis]
MCIPLNPRLIDSGVLKDFLGRSRELPLSIYVRDRPYKSIDKRTVLQLVDLLSKCSSRLFNLRVEMRGHFLPLFKDIVPPNTSASIKGLHLWCPGGSDIPNVNIDLKGISPSRLTLCRVPILRLTINWSSIAELDITRIHLTDCLELLGETFLLIRCKFSAIFQPPSNVRWSGQSIVLPSLKDIDLGFLTNESDELDVEDIDAFLKTLTLPALESFCLDMDGERFPSDCFLSLLHRSSCSLQDLKITGAVLATDGFVRVLKSIPSLKTLDIEPRSSFSPKIFFSALATPSATTAAAQRTNGAHMFLPSLITLRYHSDSPKSLPWNLIPAVFGPIGVLRQGQTWRPLRRLHFILFSSQGASALNANIDLNVFPTFLALKTAGVDLQILNDATGQDILEPLAVSLPVLKLVESCLNMAIFTLVQ